MNFEEILENKNKHQGSYRKQIYHEDHKQQGSRHQQYAGHSSQMKLMELLDKLRHSKKLRIAVALAAVFVLLVSIGLIVLLFPLLVKLYDYVVQNGLQGLITSVTAFLDTILKGSSK